MDDQERDLELQRALGRIEGKVETILTEQRRQSQYLAATSKRVGELEQYKAKLVGIAGLIAFVVSTAVSIIW